MIHFNPCYLMTIMNILPTLSIGWDIGQLLVIYGLDLD